MAGEREQYPEAWKVIDKATVGGMLAQPVEMGGGEPPKKPPIEPPKGPPDNPGMDPIADLQSRMGKVETSIEGLKHAQNLGFAAVLGAVALLTGVVLYLLQDMGGQLRGMNARFDRFLERQADSAATANARFDRLLEQRSLQAPVPLIIQVPQQAPVVPPTQPVPPPG